MSRSVSCEHCPGGHLGQTPCLASATTKANSWLLIEHSGPWPRKIEELGLPVIDRAIAHGVRPQLIRRTGRRTPTPPLRVYVGWSGEDPWLETRVVADLAELDDLDLAAVALGRRPGFGEPTLEPLLLVCTHAKRNACCARTGAPLARGLAAGYGDLVWETSHVGGDRYAANLVCLPHGIYYGALDGEAARDAVEAYLRGEVVLERLRGRAGIPEPAQAAEHFVRAHTGLLGLDQVRVISVTGTGPYMTRVTAAGNVWSGTVELVRGPGSCGHDCDETVQTYQMRDLALHSEAALV
ncbi:sucrase ferredoxin [Actinocorallia sp. A-T 12471]|uniref:sucrase ferredoxin n=1 Tax=Actinocorallia sp. A-T 12471 TaxID=3089813 RepID=UPI0029D03154|nr:sucrase ferredoxin [Actinocorallia sp. A-T 12471]MDX6739507.1 sucrase ferredoxin [Actinocorallia sp. A-T 12471]